MENTEIKKEVELQGNDDVNPGLPKGLDDLGVLDDVTETSDEESI